MMQKLVNRKTFVHTAYRLAFMVLALTLALCTPGAFAADSDGPIRLFENMTQASALADVNTIEHNLGQKVSKSAAVAVNSSIQKDIAQLHGQSVEIALFGKTVIGKIDRVQTTPEGAQGFRARIGDNPFSFLILSSHDGLSSGYVRLMESDEYYRITSNKTTGRHYLVAVSEDDAKVLEGGPSLQPPVAAQSATAQSDPIAGDPNAPASIGVLIAYTPASETYANNSEGGMANMLSTIMLTNQTVLDNSQTGITMQLVHSGLVNYTEAGNSSTDLYEFTDNDGNDNLDIVHTWRNTYGADLMHLLTDVDDTGGLAWVLNNTNGNADYAFAITRVRQASWTYTVIHEMGHNMGLGHHVAQNVQPGPGIFDYSAGWRWTGADSGKYCSVMTYEGGQYFSDGATHNRVAYFSNPSVLYQGVSTGNATSGDSARSLRELKHVIADYRSTTPVGDQYEPDNIAADATSISSGESQTHSIAPVGDVDWVQFTLTATSDVIIETSGPADDDTVLELYQSDGTTLIADDDDSGSGLFSRIERLSANGQALASGTYYAKVISYGNATEIDSYDISLTVTLPEYTLTYSAGANGSLTGTTPQTVTHGEDGASVEALPDAGYRFVDWSDGSTSNPRTDTNVQSDITVTASFAAGNYNLVYSAATGGSLTGDASQSVAHGANGTAVEAVPGTGYHFTQWSDGVTDNPRQDSSVKTEITVEAQFALDTFNLLYRTSVGGTLSGDVNQTVQYGFDGTAVQAVADTGYHFVDWSDGATSNPRTDTNVMANVAVTANFELNEYTLNYAAGANGSLSGATSQTVTHGSDGAAVTATGDTGYHFDSWSDGSTENPRTDTNVTGHLDVTASFALNQYALNYNGGSHGTISGSSSQVVNHGSNGAMVTAIPDSGYRFVQWSDGFTVNPRTDLDITADLNVTAQYEVIDYYVRYDIIFSNPYTNVEPVVKANGIYLEAYAGEGVLKIIKIPGYDNYPEIPAVFADGSLRLLYSQADVAELYVAGTLQRALAPGAHFGTVEAENLGYMAMLDYARSSSSDGADETTTTIHSGGQIDILLDGLQEPYALVTPSAPTGSIALNLLPVTVRMIGVSMEELKAPNQEAVIQLVPKKFSWTDELGGRYTDISLSRIPYVEGKEIEVGHLRQIFAMGGGSDYSTNPAAIAVASINSAARMEGPTGLTKIISRSVNHNVMQNGVQSVETYDGSIDVTTMTLGSDTTTIITRNGDLAIEGIGVYGRIHMLRAFGGELLTPSVTTGLNQNMADPDIRYLAGDQGVTGNFIAGVSSTGFPDNRGNIQIMYTNARVAPGAEINAAVWVDEQNIRLIGDENAESEGRLTYE